MYKSCSADKRHCPLPLNIYNNSCTRALRLRKVCPLASRNDRTTPKPKSPFTSKLHPARMQMDHCERLIHQCRAALSLGPRAQLQLHCHILPSGRRKSRSLTSPADTHNGAVAPSDKSAWSSSLARAGPWLCAATCRPISLRPN